MAAVAHDWHDHSLVFAVVSENSFEAVGETEEVLLRGDIGLEQLGLDVINISPCCVGFADACNRPRIFDMFIAEPSLVGLSSHAIQCLQSAIIQLLSEAA